MEKIEKKNISKAAFINAVEAEYGKAGKDFVIGESVEHHTGARMFLFYKTPPAGTDMSKPASEMTLEELKARVQATPHIATYLPSSKKGWYYKGVD